MSKPYAQLQWRRTLALTASSLALAFCAPSLAQSPGTAPATASDTQDTRLAIVTVTAQKITQDLQDVPLAVASVSGAELEKSGTASLENIGDLVPSVSFRKGTTNANSALIMRGVGTISFSIAAEPSVSTVVDGVVLSRSGQSFIDLVDLDRIEVLRGPQGTLFGKNASAGLINIVSKGGTNTPEGEVRAEYYEGNEYRLRGSFAGPLGFARGLTGRVTAFASGYDGNITNIYKGGDEKVNGYEHSGLRGILDFHAGSARYRLIADYFQGNDDCCAEVTGVSRGAALDRELGYDTKRGGKTRIVNQNLVSQTEDQQSSLTFSGDFDVLRDHELSFILGYRNWQNTEVRDGDFLPRAYVGNPQAQLHDRGTVETDQYSAEVRLASEQNQPLRYQIGAFYWQSENSQLFRRQDITCASSTLSAAVPGGAVPCDVTNTTTTLFPTANSVSDVTSENKAVFGQLDYDLTQKITLTGGLRYVEDQLDYTHTRAPAINAATGLPAVGPGLTANPAGGLTAAGGNGTNTSRGSSSNTNLSGKAAISFKPTESLLVYTSYTRGYKGPAFNVFFNHTAPNNAVPISEETSDSYEIGLKSRFLEDRVQFNLAAFNAKYEGFQANNFILLNGAAVSNLTNAGTVETRGIEADLIILVTEGLKLNASAASTRAEVEKFNPNPLTNAPNAQNGTPLPLAPKFSWNAGADYETGLGAYRLYVGSQFNYTSKQYSDFGYVGPLDSYGILNASVGISDADDRYRLTLVGRNLGDQPYVLLNTTAGQRLQIPRDADRYFGVTLRAKL